MAKDLLPTERSASGGWDRWNRLDSAGDDSLLEGQLYGPTMFNETSCLHAPRRREAAAVRDRASGAAQLASPRSARSKAVGGWVEVGLVRDGRCA